jgi:hypothetical protein
MKNLKFVLFLVQIVLFEFGLSAGAKQIQISTEELLDKIKGGWAGQMIGVAFGAPTEFRAQGRLIEEDLPPWEPKRVENAIHQDDLYVEMTFLKVLEKYGLKARSKDFGEAFKDSKYSLWHANAAARRNLNRGINAPWSGHPKYNMHANDIDFQIEADFIGLISPGLPRFSNRICNEVGRVMNYGDGLYGGMFIGGMYAAAFFEQDPVKVVKAGLACIPEKSSYAAVINDLLDLYERYGNDWKKVWRIIEERWDRDDVCPDGALSGFNIDAKLNGAYVAMGLLFGGKDFEKTMEISTRCGQDSDCNPSSAAGILGVMLGYEKIPDKFKSGIPKIADTKFEFTDYSFNEVVRITERLALEQIKMAGGNIVDGKIIVPLQKPKAAKLEQWSPGVPFKVIPVKSNDWKFEGNWRFDNGNMISEDASATATLNFMGVAVAIVGQLGQDGGRADVYVDGRKSSIVLDAYIVKNTYENCLWHIYGLKPGNHSIKIVKRSDKDSRSTGQVITINRAICYRNQ